MPEQEIPAPPWSRTRRRPRARRALSQEAIVDAAMGVLRREGLDAVTMRRVGQELDTGAASLYAHVADKEELHSLMLDRVAGELTVPAPDPARWQDQIRQLARSMLRLMESYPGIARVPIANVPTGPNSLRMAEGMLAILRAGGVPDRAAAMACDILPLYVTATAFEASVYAERGTTEEDHADRIAEMREYFAALPPDRFPNIVALAVPLTSGAGEERFEFGLDLMLRGLGELRSD